MQNWYKYIMFYRYPGELTARAFAFNDKRQATNAIELGALVIEIVKATSFARGLCSQVNSAMGGMPVSVLREKLDQSFKAYIHPEPWESWLEENED